MYIFSSFFLPSTWHILYRDCDRFRKRVLKKLAVNPKAKTWLDETPLNNLFIGQSLFLGKSSSFLSFEIWKRTINKCGARHKILGILNMVSWRFTTAARKFVNKRIRRNSIMPLKASFEGLATSQEETHRLHFVPCKIKCQDPLEANVKPYFTDAIKANDRSWCSTHALCAGQRLRY